jgi:hypothetical protein
MSIDCIYAAVEFAGYRWLILFRDKRHEGTHDVPARTGPPRQGPFFFHAAQ